MRKKLTSLLLCAALLVSAFAGCSRPAEESSGGSAADGQSAQVSEANSAQGEEDSSREETGSSSEYEEFLTIDVFDHYANYQGMQGGWFGEMLKEKFNVELNIIAPSVAGGGDTLFQTRSASGNLGDLVMYPAQKGRLQDLVTADLILDLTPYLDGQENLQSYMEAITYTSENNVKEEGLWCVPSEISRRAPTEPMMGINPNSAIFLRWDLYGELGYPPIKTLEDLLPVLKDMQALCPTSDSGQPTYGISLFKDWDGDYVSNVAELTAMLGYDRVGNAFHMADGSGEIESVLDPDFEYVRMIRLFNQANQMGILDPESTTQNYDTLTSKYADGAVLYTPLPWHGGTAYNVDAHLSEGKGIYMAELEEAKIRQWGAYNLGNTEIVFMVGSKAQDPQRMVDLIDWLYSPEGIACATDRYCGPEGLLYTMEGDQPVFTDLGKECFIEGDGTMPAAYGGGSWKDGGSKLSYKLVSSGDVNPDNGIVYDPTLWDSYLELTSNPVWAAWQTQMGATTPIEFLLDKDEMVVSPGISFSPEVDSTEIETLRAQVKAVIVENTWKAIFAATDEECEEHIQTMIETAKGLGYDELLAVDTAKAQAKRDAWAEILG